MFAVYKHLVFADPILIIKDIVELEKSFWGHYDFLIVEISFYSWIGISFL